MEFLAGITEKSTCRNGSRWFDVGVQMRYSRRAL